MLELNPRLPVRAHNGGLFISRGQGTHPHRVIGSWELIFVREGVLMVEEEEKRFEVGAGESLLLWPGRRHRATGDYPPDLSFYWIHFSFRDGKVASPILRSLCPSTRPSLVLTISPNSSGASSTTRKRDVCSLCRPACY
jgi:hypothetical protein